MTILRIEELAKLNDDIAILVLEKFKQKQLKKGIKINTIRGQLNTIKKKIKLFRYVSERGGCKICREKNFDLIEFDHRCQKTKISNISNMIYNNGWDKIEQELDKCDIMCVKCHRLRTSKQLNYHTIEF